MFRFDTEADLPEWKGQGTGAVGLERLGTGLLLRKGSKGKFKVRYGWTMVDIKYYSTPTFSLQHPVPQA